MNPLEIKNLLIKSLDPDTNTIETSKKVNEIVSFDFKSDFSNKIIDRIFSTSLTLRREVEFTRYMYFAFSRIALTGVAAIVLLLISIFIMEGSISINSLLGLSDSYNESIVCLLTGN